MRRFVVLFVAAASLLLLSPDAGSATAVTELASVDAAGTQGNDASGAAAISADGRFVAFQSWAANLVPADTNGVIDVFVHDRWAGTTERVSVDSAQSQANDGSLNPAISADGRFVAFDSTATNLVAGDSNNASDIFVRDRVQGTTTRVSVDSFGNQANGFSYQPSISADGRFIAFASTATNLSGLDTNGTQDIFVRDLYGAETVRVSVGPVGLQANGYNAAPAISADGRYVAFQSNASNLVAGDTNGLGDIFVYDRTLATTSLISVSSAGAQTDNDSYQAAISADGRFVAFHSQASTLAPDDTNASNDVFLRDRDTDVDGVMDEPGSVSTDRISIGYAGQGNNHSYSASLSADGRYVAFDSQASNLVAGDTNGASDIFIRDTLGGYTVRASLAGDAIQALGGPSYNPSLSSGGTVLAFESDAINLVSGDANWVTDVFARSPDDDSDGILAPRDNCPGSWNPDQTDSDSDGQGDVCDSDDDNDTIPDWSDACPTYPEDFDGFQDGDGCPDYDNDQDGICDPDATAWIGCTGWDVGYLVFDPAGTLPAPLTDCRNMPEDLDGFHDGDGCPEPDNDNDGHPDTSDACPGTDSQTGPDGMLGAPQDLNHNGFKDASEATFSTDDTVLVFEDWDGVIDSDGCHDSPGDDFDGDSFGAMSAGMPSFRDEREVFLGTDPMHGCAATATANDEPSPDAWPVDFNDDQKVTLADVLQMRPVFNNPPAYATRYDFNADGSIALADVLVFRAFFNTTCVR